MMASALAELDAPNACLSAIPLPGSLRRGIEANWEVTRTCNSNATEGNTLTLAETKAVPLDSVKVGGHPLREHPGAVNHREAWRLMRHLSGPLGPLLEDDVLFIHRVILSGVQTENAGVYRRDRVWVVGCSLIFHNPTKVPQLMGEFMDTVNLDEGLQPVLRAASAHYGLVAVHPSADGNGRTARLLISLVLIRARFPLPCCRSLRKRPTTRRLK